MPAYFNHSLIDKLFSDRSVILKYIEVERALALVQGDLGVIPKEASSAIADHINVDDIDYQQYHDDFKKVGFPIVGLIKQLQSQVPDNYGEYLHWGATTQDIMDSGLMLLLKDFIGLLQKELVKLKEQLESLVKQYSASVMIGRSQLQHAMPITFGYKVSTWLAPVLRHLERLRTIESSLGTIQFGGAVGTLASLGEIGLSVKSNLAKKLQLNDSTISWHTQRDQIAEFIAFLAVLSTSISKIGKDILYMSQTDVAEVVEKGEGRSSTMPNKRNPIRTQNTLLACKAVRGQLQSFLDATVQDHERGAATWQLEWELIPRICSNIYYALTTTNELFLNLEIRTERMIKNLNSTGGIVYAEALMMRLAEKIGRQSAHDLIDELVSESLSGKPFYEVLAKSKSIREILTEAEIQDLIIGEQHIRMGALMAKQLVPH